MNTNQSFLDAKENPFFVEEPKPKKKNFFVDIMQAVVVALSISVFLYVFIITPNEVDGPSMQPNLETRDLLFTSKLHKWFNGTSLGNTLGLSYKRGDVVVFQKPSYDNFVKRVIGLPGEKIRIKDGKFYINEELLGEEYNLDNDQKLDGTFLIDGDPSVEIPPNEYFVAGDHRDVSLDSRSLGFIKQEWIKGRVMVRFWPLDKFGFIGSGKSTLVAN